jgi:fucose permease
MSISTTTLESAHLKGAQPITDLDMIPEIPLTTLDNSSARDEDSILDYTHMTTAKSQFPRVLACFLSVFSAGYNDACLGALIPYLEIHYNINTAFVALVYIANFLGFVVAGFGNARLTMSIGIGGVLSIGAALQALSYAFYSWAPPYALFVVMFFFAGCGIALQDAQCNAYIAGLDNAHRWLGYFHAAYGFGGFIAPFVATAIVTTTGKFNYFYFTALGLAVVNFFALCYAFRTTLFKAPFRRSTDNTDFIRTILRMKIVWIASIFLFLYVGAEVSSGGWVVSFMIDIRGASPQSAGYSSSGFWAGLTLGRIALAELTGRWGEKRMTFGYIAICAALVFVVW